MTAHSAVVVGGGPAGALLAYLLASRGIPVTLVERHSDFAREFRGEGLAPGGQKMFDEAGLWEEFLSLPHTVLGGAQVHFKGHRFLSLRLNWEDRLPPRFVSQPAMLEMLIEQAAAHPEFTFRRGVSVAGPIHDGDRVVGVELRGLDGPERIEADYIFACDGRFSTMRQASGLDQPRRPEAFDVVWCKLPMPAFCDGQVPTVRGYFGSGHFGLCIPSYDGLLQLGWVIKKGSYRAFREMGVEGWIEEIARHVATDMAEHLRAHATNATQPFLLDVVCDCYEHWSAPGMLMLGDAAHPMSPVGAQGINVALRDAVVVANHFVPPLLQGVDPSALDIVAKQFQSARLREVTKTQAMQRKVPLFLLSRARWLDVMMAAVGAVTRFGFVQKLVDNRIRKPNPLIDGFSEITLQV